MEIRKLTDKHEWLESERVLATAFLQPWDEEEARSTIQAQAEGARPRLEQSWGLFDDDGTMLTSMACLKRTLSFGGEMLSAGEVHMVGSIPERRGGGGVRALMGTVLRDFRDSGDSLAVLIPFSCSFYRKFGFELASRMVCQRVGIEQLAGFSCGYHVTRVSKEADLVAVRGLWESHARSHDLVELRGDEAWAWKGNGEFGEPDFLHPERQRYAYVLWDGDKVVAYVRFSFFHEPHMPFVGELRVHDLVFAHPAALHATLGFLYGMRAKVTHLNFELPDIDLATLVPEGDKVEQRLDCHVMARLLDPAQLLRLMPQPYGLGSYVFGITDGFLPEVAGRWRVTYHEGRTVSVEATDLKPDLEVEEPIACQLILGRIGLADALLRPDVCIAGNEEALRRAFVQRPVHLVL